MNFGATKNLLYINRYFTSFLTIRTNLSYNYCQEVVRKNDFENYICALILPKSTQQAAFALRCLNIELSNINNSVSKPEIGKIKFKFWENEMKILFDNDSKTKINESPLMKELIQINFSNSNLYRIWINRIFDARLKLMYEIPFKSMKEAYEYFDAINGSLLYILANHMNIADVDVDHGLSHLGRCQGLIILIRGITMLAYYRQKVIIPNDVMTQYQLSHSDIIRIVSAKNSDDKRLKELVYHIASAAHEEALKTLSVYSRIKSNPTLVRRLFAPVIPAIRYLEKLRIADFNLFNKSLYQTDNLLAFHVYWKVIVKRNLQ